MASFQPKYCILHFNDVFHNSITHLLIVALLIIIMDVLIIEDEIAASKRLTKLIQEVRPNVSVIEVLDSIESSVKWLKTCPAPALIFMDIQLADGLSFEIFNTVKIDVPVIFTTAFDQYTLRAFKVTGIDYLLKPLDIEELHLAMNKYDALFHNAFQYDIHTIQQVVKEIQTPVYKERFLVKNGQQLQYVPIQSARYFYSEDGLVFLKTINGLRYAIDYTLEKLEEVISPKNYMRINRKMIIHIDAIEKIHTYFNSRLKLELRPDPKQEVIVSRDRVATFKNWLDD